MVSFFAPGPFEYSYSTDKLCYIFGPDKDIENTLWILVFESKQYVQN